MQPQEAAGPQQQPGCDKGGLFWVTLILAVVFGYQTFVTGPEIRAWQKQKIEFEEHKAKEAAKKKKAAEARKGGVATPGSASTAAPGTAALTARKTDPKPKPEPKTEPKPKPKPKPATAHARKDGIKWVTGPHAMTLSTAGASISTLRFTAVGLSDTQRSMVKETIYAPDQPRELDKRIPGLFAPMRKYLDEVRSFAIQPLEKEHQFASTADWKHEKLKANAGHRFTLELPNGLRLVKTYLLAKPVEVKEGEEKPLHFHVRLKITVENPTGKDLPFGYHLFGPAGMIEQEIGRSSFGQEACIASRNVNGGRSNKDIEDSTSGFEKIGTPDVSHTTAKDKERTIAFYGLVTKYFAGVVIPMTINVEEADAFGLLQYTGKRPSAEEKEKDDGLGKQGLARGLIAERPVPAGGKLEHEFLLYIGPRQNASIFEQEPYAKTGVQEVVYYGWFGKLGRILLWILSGLYAIVGNWGIAILLLTFLVRGAMMPLSMYSQKNMLRMQKLAPEINALKEKYSKEDGSMAPDQQRAFQQEQMELWRRHGVNPIGCIGPIFLQMPIFIGLYNALNSSSAIRHSPFFGWLTDLSAPDVLFRMPFTIPLISTNAFSVLPLLMVATYILQQKMQPAPTDPKMAEQQKIMKFIFPLFGFILYTMPSGLMLYFITSSMWGIAEQKVIKGRLEAQDEEGKKPTPSTAPMPGTAAVGREPPPKPDVSPAKAAAQGKKKKKKKKKGR